MIPTSTSLSFCFFDPRGRPWDLKVPIWCRGTIWTTWGCVKTLWFWAIPACGRIAWTPQTNWHHFLANRSLATLSFTCSDSARSKPETVETQTLGEPWSHHTYKILYQKNDSHFHTGKNAAGVWPWSNVSTSQLLLLPFCVTWWRKINHWHSMASVRNSEVC